MSSSRTLESRDIDRLRQEKVSAAELARAQSYLIGTRAIALQRRSAVALDGVSSIDREKFIAMLLRAMPADAPPWDALWWSPRIHLALFVHRVDGVEPGLYLLPDGSIRQVEHELVQPAARVRHLLDADDLHIFSPIRPRITISGHHPLAGGTPPIFQMPAILPNLQPFPIFQPPRNTSHFGASFLPLKSQQ
jgi:hypothetical protein